jgi:hypothetical protein
MGPIDNMTVARFWMKAKRVPSGCWEWQGHRTRMGYGQAWSGRRAEFAHRFAWMIVNGAIPSEGRTDICHKCDNPACVNPSHLFLGTTSDNVQDMLRKGRGVVGEHARGAKLTEAGAREIIRLAHEGWTFKEIAQKFGVSEIQVGRIAHGTSWRRLGGCIPKIPAAVRHLPGSSPERMALLGLTPPVPEPR